MKTDKYTPAVLCFNGQRAAQQYLEGEVPYGLQADGISTTKIFVAPSTTGAANMWWEISLWHDLARLSNIT